MIDKQRQPASDELRRRSRLVLQTLLVLLVPLVLALLGPLLLSLITPLSFAAIAERPPTPYPFIILVIFFSALVILVRLGRPTISALTLIGVWTLLTTLSLLRFGVTSNFPALLIVPICIAGLLIDRVACLSLAGLGTILVGGSAWFEQRQLPPLSFPPTGVLPAVPTFAAIFWIGLFWTAALLTSLLASNLQRALQQSRAQAEELRELSDQLEARVVQQTEQILASERESATLAERTRLAREIHDTLAQGLTGIVVQLGAAKRALAAEPFATDEHLALAERMAREALAEARRSVWNLRAPALERGELDDALRSLGAHQARLGTTVTFEQQGNPWPLAPETESALLRVAQEALANIVKHAQASQAALILAYEPDGVTLTIRDDGVGFDDPSLNQLVRPGPWGGFGLAGMRERLAALGGTLELHNDHGAVVAARVLRNRQDEQD